VTGGAQPTPSTASRSQPSGPRRVFWSLGAIVLVVVGLFAVGLFQARNVCACATPPPVASYPPSPVEGVVAAVDSAGLGRVSGFTIRVAGGATMAFELGSLENPTEFSPSHIAEHMASSQPVRVFFRLEDARAVVYRLEDATVSPASPPT
jgi:hypothetical protein